MSQTTRARTTLVMIYNWHPYRLNQLMHGHWSKGARRKKSDRRIIEAYCFLAQVPKATCKRRVHLTIILGPGERAGDPDGHWKSLLDGLVACRALRNDSPRWVELAPVQFERGTQKATRIILEDI